MFDQISLGIAAQLGAQEQEIADQAAGHPIDFPTIWAANQKRLDYYHLIATSQSRNSFRNGQLASVLGFGMVIVLGIIAARTENTTGAIAAGSVGIAGAAFSAYIGATFMKAQSEASAQLREYFLQPVEAARLLSAERLLEGLEGDNRAQAVNLIIQSTMLSTKGVSASAEVSR
jgi:hypothetical protein